MKYFLDTEFLEGTQFKRFLGIPFSKTKPTIDLISIGIVAEDGREYYAISKDFNLDEAWNRCDIKDRGIDGVRKEYWIRENVLKPIWIYLADKQGAKISEYSTWYMGYPHSILGKIKQFFSSYRRVEEWDFNYRLFKKLLKKYGKTNEQIAKEVKSFCLIHWEVNDGEKWGKLITPQFYGYMCDFDYVAMTWLFGGMSKWPDVFPYYFKDLAQMMDRKIDVTQEAIAYMTPDHFNGYTSAEKYIKEHPRYPNQPGEHNALADARWNLKLYKFIQSL